MGVNQIRLLKLLGYVESKEDGAILEHKSIPGHFVWDDDKFDAVMVNFPYRILDAERSRIASQIRQGR